jgi:hypothetical protein
MVGSGGSKKRGKDLRDLGFIEEGDFRIEVGGMIPRRRRRRF